MTRLLIAVGLALALCFGVLGVVVYLSRDEDRVAVDSRLADRLTKAVGDAAEGDGGTVDLAEVAGFEWERVVIVARGTPRAEISRRVGFAFKGDLPYDVESKAILLFLRDGALARFADYRSPLPISGLPMDLERDEAILIVGKSGVEGRAAP